MELRVLFIEDDEKLGQNLQKSFDGATVSGYTLKARVINQFEDGISAINKYDFDLVILDLYKDKDAKDEDAGIKVLDSIRKSAFVPVVFYTGHAYKITSLNSEIVGVVSKGDGIDALTKEIERIINSKIAVLKSQIYGHLRESLRKYFWETVDAEKKVFVPGKSDVSLGYLLLRRFANSLSKENIKELLGDDKIKTDKAHPMEFYIYPVNPDSSKDEHQAGEILEKDGVFYAVLTPDCDLVLRNTGLRKADKVLLATAKEFKALPDFIKREELKNKKDRSEKENQQLSNAEGKLKTWMSNRGGEQDRYFFLPSTPFIDNLVIDFQIKTMVDYNDLKSFRRVAKLDLPYAQSMISSFIRYYNRIGIPDIDVDYVLAGLK
jgi:DNA-binding response OmpR family regulator